MKTVALLSVIVLMLTGINFYTNQPTPPEPMKFRNNKVTQIGLVVRDIEKTAQAYADLLGVEAPDVIITDVVEDAHTRYRGELTPARAKLAFFHIENITIELIEPVGAPSTWQETLETKGEGIHHIAFQVQDMEENVALLEKQGARLIQHGDFTGGSYAYVDATPKLGVILELLTSTN